eukprot:6762578-Ditylum_brightwellii.AAC.1
MAGSLANLPVTMQRENHNSARMAIHPTARTRPDSDGCILQLKTVHTHLTTTQHSPSLPWHSHFIWHCY